jgi:hypothetical protein
VAQIGEAGAREVIVKGESNIDTQPAHDGKARGIGEGEILIIELCQEPKRIVLVCLSNANDLNVAGVYPLDYFACSRSRLASRARFSQPRQ